jgi:hypothetical protein
MTKGVLIQYADIVITTGFEVLIAVSTKMAVFWVIVPGNLVEVY